MGRLAPCRFVVGPVERQRRVVEQLGEALAVGGFRLGVCGPAPGEYVRAEEKRVPGLLNGDVRSRHRFAGGIDYQDGCIGATMLLDAGLSAGQKITAARGYRLHTTEGSIKRAKAAASGRFGFRAVRLTAAPLSWRM